MNKDVAAEFGQLIASQEKLLTILANNQSALDEFPKLREYVAERNPNTRAYNKLSKAKKQEFYEILDARIFWLGYESSQELYKNAKLNFLIERVALLVGDDLSKINSLTVQDIGAEILVKYLNLISNSLIAQDEPRPSFPWMAEKGRWDPQFWANAHLAFDAWNSGYASHYKLDSWCQDNIDCRAPQSSIKFFKVFGDPREIPEWAMKYGDKEK
ncbi:hypothetical protein P7F88_09960 [Vibrio hannami]|uniref:hypothetical protein n=1 Tax=Vibrio hannami TaxID=2717094 RepID=UPI0024103C92|nr:hypothetical protein [Vibrio hannami]MDG3086416.1 hypothetical protein [Vibrio hannami]